MLDALHTVVSNSFIHYAGCLIEKKQGKFVALKKEFDTVAGAKQHIDESFIIILKSIK